MPTTARPRPRHSRSRRRARGWLLLREALDALSPPQAEALALHFLFDRTIAEIAAMTDAAEETVRSRLRLGKQALRTKIEKDGRFRALREGAVENTVTPTAGEEEEP